MVWAAVEPEPAAGPLRKPCSALGYIGLPTAVALATRGVEAVGVDVNEETVDAVSRGVTPFVEPDLAIGVSGAVSMGRLTATTKTPAAFVVAG